MYEHSCPYCGSPTPNPMGYGQVYPQIPTRACRYCGNLTTWIQAYDRWYCYFCNRYS